MYQPKVIESSFQKLVGFLPGNDPSTPALSGDLLLSDSGIYVSNVHPLCNLDLIYLAAPDFSVSKYRKWVTGSNYTAGTIISYQNVLYSAVATITNSIVDPQTAGVLVWALAYPFQNYVQKQIFNNAASNLIGDMVTVKKLQHMAKAMLERQQLYRGLGDASNPIVSLGNFVGFEIRPMSAEGLLMIIDMVGMQATQSQEELNYYLYHTSNLGAPLQIFPTPITSAGIFSWKDLVDTNGKPCILGYMGLEGVSPMGIDSNGSYLFGYHQRDLEGQAINKTWDCSTICSSCDSVNLTMYNKWSRHTRLRNIMIPGSSFDADYNLVTSNFISYGNTTNWGMNLSITVRCDITNTITYSRLQVAKSFSKSLALEVMKLLAYSPRINPGEGSVKSAALAELNSKIGDSLINDYNKEVQSVNLDFSGFSAACMPEDEMDGIEFLPGI